MARSCAYGRIRHVSRLSLPRDYLLPFRRLWWRLVVIFVLACLLLTLKLPFEGANSVRRVL